MDRQTIINKGNPMILTGDKIKKEISEKINDEFNLEIVGGILYLLPLDNIFIVWIEPYAVNELVE